MNKMLWGGLVPLLLFGVIIGGCVESNGQRTYTGTASSISYDAGSKVTKLTLNNTTIANGKKITHANSTTLFISGAMQAIDIGAKYRITIELQREDEKDVPAKLVSLKKLEG